MIRQKTGNILNATENIIVHSVNHQGVMGAGLALQLKNKYPQMFEQYGKMCKTIGWDTIRNIGVFDLYAISDRRYIASIFGQRYFGRGLQTDYNVLFMGLYNLKIFAEKNNLSIAIPHGIGCGLGGGNWDFVSGYTEGLFYDYSRIIDVSVYKLEN